MSGWKFLCRFSFAFAGLMCLTTWSVLGDHSPFRDYFFHHTALPNVVRQLLVIPYIVLLIVNPGSEFGDVVVATTAEFLQWLVLGFALALFIHFGAGLGAEKRNQAD